VRQRARPAVASLTFPALCYTRAFVCNAHGRIGSTAADHRCVEGCTSHHTKHFTLLHLSLKGSFLLPRCRMRQRFCPLAGHAVLVWQSDGIPPK